MCAFENAVKYLKINMSCRDKFDFFRINMFVYLEAYVYVIVCIRLRVCMHVFVRARVCICMCLSMRITRKLWKGSPQPELIPITLKLSI